MHQPPHRYVTGPITPASIPKHSRWTCMRFHSGGADLNWCGVKHTAQKYAEKHCLDPKGPADHHPEEIHRIERYSDTELSYRGWTDHMMELLLGDPDAQDLGAVHVYAYALYDADTVHAAERNPDFDRLAAQAHNSGTMTIFEDDVTAILEAISMPLELELPFSDYSKLLKYAKKDIVRMTKEAALRYGKKYIPVKVGDEEGFAHAAARCSWRSHAANKFVYRIRGHHLSHEACDIVNARLAHAALQILPEYKNVLSRFEQALERIPPPESTYPGNRRGASRSQTRTAAPSCTTSPTSAGPITTFHRPSHRRHHPGARSRSQPKTAPSTRRTRPPHQTQGNLALRIRRHPRQGRPINQPNADPASPRSSSQCSSVLRKKP